MPKDTSPTAVARYPGQPRRFNPHRKRGLVLILIALPAAALWALVLGLVREHDVITNPRTFRLLGIPFAVAIIAALLGLAKLVFGRTLRELGEAWERMAGWQRGIAGTIIVAIAIVGIVTIAGVAITLLL